MLAKPHDALGDRVHHPISALFCEDQSVIKAGEWDWTKKKTTNSCPTKLCLPSLPSLIKERFTQSSHVHYHPWILAVHALKPLFEIGEESKEERVCRNLPWQSFIWHTTCSTLLTLIRRVAVRSDRRCRPTVFECSVCVCVCVDGLVRLGVVGVGAQLSWKKKQPKISLLLMLCRNISKSAPPDIKMGSARVHSRGHTPFATTSPGRRHVVMSKRRLSCKLLPGFPFGVVAATPRGAASMSCSSGMFQFIPQADLKSLSNMFYYK